jgi:16S rRNA (uracil1498-N3)-methyltransferase
VNLILLSREELAGGGTVTVTGSRAIHLCDVLRVEPGTIVRVGVLDGAVGEATVVSAALGSVMLTCRFDGVVPSSSPVDLLLAVPRPKVLRRLWAQLAALGVGRIILTNAARVERNYFDSHVLNEQIYRPLLIEGLQQARDTRVPSVSVHRQFRKLVEDDLDTMCPQRVRLVADPGDAPSPHDTARDAARASGDTRVLLAIGPEGGWNAFELELLGARGFERVSVGSRTLRTDTACIALLSLVQDGLAAAAGLLREPRPT